MGEEASAAHASLLHGRAMLESSCSLDVHLNVCASKLCVCVRVCVCVCVCVTRWVACEDTQGCKVPVGCVPLPQLVWIGLAYCPGAHFIG